MSKLTFKKFENELGELVSFLIHNSWEYHVDSSPSEEEIVCNFNSGWYKETYWIEYSRRKVGLLTLHDLNDTIPLFDIRLGNKYRGKGIGAEAIRWMINYIFSLPDKKIRIEAYTRSDNIAMRKTLSNCGFVKEGYLRNAWENNDGTVSDSICYGIIRHDWENHVVTPIKFDDIPF